ncbi:hypothetical protein ABIB49_003407 [Arthrobacter sp. UYCu512]|uniref:hypothetical protein n=1 Tax=Arthrobacter sp. UYCu512 TaxID=3156338 RepID=UPI003397AD75
MGLRSLFRKRPTSSGPTEATLSAAGPEPLTAEQLVELEAAWAELTAAAEASEVTNFSACTRGGRSWTENAAAVRAVAATLRELPAMEDQTPK